MKVWINRYGPPFLFIIAVLIIMGLFGLAHNN